MGDAIYCDRCKALINRNTGNIHNFKIVELWNEDMILDFCDGCRPKLDSFVHGDDLKKKKD